MSESRLTDRLEDFLAYDWGDHSEQVLGQCKDPSNLVDGHSSALWQLTSEENLSMLEEENLRFQDELFGPSQRPRRPLPRRAQDKAGNQQEVNPQRRVLGDENEAPLCSGIRRQEPTRYSQPGTVYPEPGHLSHSASATPASMSALTVPHDDQSREVFLAPRPAHASTSRTNALPESSYKHARPTPPLPTTGRYSPGLAAVKSLPAPAHNDATQSPQCLFQSQVINPSNFDELREFVRAMPEGYFAELFRIDGRFAPSRVRHSPSAISVEGIVGRPQKSLPRRALSGGAYRAASVASGSANAVALPEYDQSSEALLSVRPIAAPTSSVDDFLANYAPIVDVLSSAKHDHASQSPQDVVQLQHAANLENGLFAPNTDAQQHSFESFDFGCLLHPTFSTWDGAKPLRSDDQGLGIPLDPQTFALPASITNEFQDLFHPHATPTTPLLTPGFYDTNTAIGNCPSDPAYDYATQTQDAVNETELSLLELVRSAPKWISFDLSGSGQKEVPYSEGVDSALTVGVPNAGKEGAITESGWHGTTGQVDVAEDVVDAWWTGGQQWVHQEAGERTEEDPSQIPSGMQACYDQRDCNAALKEGQTNVIDIQAILGWEPLVTTAAALPPDASTSCTRFQADDDPSRGVVDNAREAAYEAAADDLHGDLASPVGLLPVNAAAVDVSATAAADSLVENSEASAGSTSDSDQQDHIEADFTRANSGEVWVRCTWGHSERRCQEVIRSDAASVQRHLELRHSQDLKPKRGSALVKCKGHAKGNAEETALLPSEMGKHLLEQHLSADGPWRTCQGCWTLAIRWNGTTWCQSCISKWVPKRERDEIWLAIKAHERAERARRIAA